MLRDRRRTARIGTTVRLLGVKADKGGSSMASRTRRKKRATTSSRKSRATTARSRRKRAGAARSRTARSGVRRRTAATRRRAGAKGGARTLRAAGRPARPKTPAAAAQPETSAEQTTLGTLTPGLPPIAPPAINPAPARPVWGTEDHESETENEDDEEPM
jgi:hypothetical protein